MRLLKPLLSETIERAAQEADSLYRGARFGEAQAAFATVVELDPLHTFSWLRLGNLHQQAGRDVEALDAYGRASAPPPASASAAEARGKALLNIALLSVARAGRAMDELDAMNALTLEAMREEAARQVADLRQRAEFAMAGRGDTGSRLPNASTGRVAGPPSSPPVRAAETAGPRVGPPPARTETTAKPAAEPRIPLTAGTTAAFEPYTVDRWIAKPRRAATRPGQARSTLTEPLSPTPLPPMPVVESIRGGGSHGARK
jgi:hypothetical protein